MISFIFCVSTGDIEEDGRHAVDLISPDKQLFTEVMVEQSLAEAKPASAATTASGRIY